MATEDVSLRKLHSILNQFVEESRGAVFPLNVFK